MSTETKTLRFDIKAVGIAKDAEGQEFGQIEALGAVFDNVDDGDDRIRPGAFTRTIKNSKERASSRGKKYLVPMLWQHDTHEVIGGWHSLEETPDGLLGKGDISLATQRGREYYALAKAGMTDQFSIIYDIPTGGAKYAKDGVRELIELRLFSIDPVTFAMNDSTSLVRVKAADDSRDSTTVCGNTKGPIGPRDEAWDGAKAERQIWAAAYSEESGEVDKTLAKKYFMACSGDGTKKGDYSYPFWFVGSSPHICVGAVKAIAAAIQGARGASAPEGLKPKIESLYRRVNAKYPDDPQLTPPWKDDDGEPQKGARMPTSVKAASERQQKTFQEHYTEQQCKDLLRDWQDVVLHAFTSAVYDTFTIGDQPEADVNEALDALKTAVTDWVSEAVKYELSDYIESQSDTYSGGTEYRMQNGTTSGYGYYGMARTTPLHSKAMTAGDATTGGFLTTDHVDKLKGAAEDATNAVDKHVKAMHDAAKSVKALIGGVAAVTPAKAGRAFSAANEQTLSDHADAIDGAAQSLQKAMSRHLGTVSSVADDLATVLQGSEAAYGTDSGTPARGEQEGKTRGTGNATTTTTTTPRAPSPATPWQTRAPHTTPSRQQQSKGEDTPREEDVAVALAELRKLRTPA